MPNNEYKKTISEFGLIGTSDEVQNANKFLSAQVAHVVYQELEAFAKTDSGKDVLGFAGNGKYLQAKSYVGTIQTKSGFILEILPKTVNDDKPEDSKKIFMKLLHLLHKLPNYKNIDTANFERIKNIDIFEIFIVMFLDEVGQIIKKGIKSDYSSREDNLFFLKGKLKFNEHIKQNSIHKERFYVEYDDYNQNRPANRLIKSTLQLLSKLSKDFQNIRRIRLYMEHMNWVESSMNVDNDFRSMKLGRGMEHYRYALIWSKVFLKKESFSSFSGETIAFAILYPMEKLFESFVEWYLNKTESDFNVIAQSGEHDFVCNDKKRLFGVRPDFLLKQGEVVKCVADAKWKLIDKEADFSQGDFYQLFAYKNIFLKNNTDDDRNLRIYYPKTEFLKGEIVYKYFDGGKINIIPLDIKDELSKSKTNDQNE